ncbi:MAG TPA: aminoacyl-tRNA hydrolase [Actinomycetota bacterium]|nr:aminoacyl-tRNA hydrolase [Actinomycetota bacterium]
MDGAWLVAGLGNPGDRYADTRHNAGAMVVARLSDRFGAKLRKVRFVAVTAAEARHDGVPLLLTVATTYMNESGPPIASFAKKRSVPAERIIACHDEIDLPFGTLRVKRGGSTAGHHGLDSLAQALGSQDFYRVRIGVGRPARREQNIDFVLEPFAKRERDDAALLIEEAADAVLSLATEGLDRTQERFNRSVIAPG